VGKFCSEEFSDYGKFLWAHRGSILFGGSRLEQLTAFLEFEWIFGIGVAFVILLMTIFYVVYPYDKDRKDVPLD
jgi:hypothetical protein